MKWIPEKRKPKLDEDVLIGGWERYMGSKWEWTVGVGCWYYSECYNKRLWAPWTPEVWMPLPKPFPLTKKEKAKERAGIAARKKERKAHLLKEMKEVNDYKG